jgi:hypothetical protein
MKSPKRCTHCLLPETYPGIRFDSKGVCQFCRGEEKEFEYERRSRDDLDRLIADARAQGGPYDVIVGLSGGKDSSYVALFLKKTYGVRILGINIDIGYRSGIASENLDNLVRHLDIDLVTLRPSPGLLNGLFERFLSEKGEFCSVCNNLGYLLVAGFALRQRQVLGFSPLLVGGWSKQYEYQPGVSVTNMAYFFSNLTPELLQELSRHPFIDSRVVGAFQRVADPRQAMLGTEANRDMGTFAVQGIQLPDYVDWDVRRIPEILAREVGWRQPEGSHDSHFDCRLFPIKEYLKYRKYGLTQETIKNSRLIREGLMSREEALDRAGLEQTTEPEAMRDFLETLGLDVGDINWDADWST